MKKAAVLGVFAIILVVSCQLLLTAQAVTPDTVLAKMEQSNKDFPFIQAKIRMVVYKDLIGVFDEAQVGKIWISHTGNGPRQIKVEFDKPLKELWLVDKSVYTKYFPNTKSGLTFKFEKEYQPEAECILLGLCQSSSFIRQNYSVVLGTPEIIDGVKTTVLELTPKDAKRAANFKKFKLWLDLSKGYPIQTCVYLPNKNYKQVNFTEINTKSFSGSVFKIDVDKKADMQTIKTLQ